MKLVRRVAAVLLLLFAGAIVLVVWMAGGIQSPTSSAPKPISITTAAATKTSTTGELVVVSYNVAWGYGPGSEGTGTNKGKAHLDKNLDAMAKLLGELDPDIVLFQEVDFDATRSFGEDQLKRLVEHTRLKHLAYGESWTANWVPFPYWPIEDQFGSMRSGGAVASAFPIKQHDLHLWSKPKENPFWYNLFYPFRYAQVLSVDWQGEKLTVLNAHLEAFKASNRIEQAHLYKKLAQGVMQPLLIMGGDMNSVPPEAPLRKGYPDEPDNSHEDDPTVTVLRETEGLTDTISADTLIENPDAVATFPADKPNRKLDYIFVGDGFEVVSAKVIRTGDISDHLPVVAKIRRKN